LALISQVERSENDQALILVCGIRKKLCLLSCLLGSKLKYEFSMLLNKQMNRLEVRINACTFQSAPLQKGGKRK
jgi:hypothetical protein